MTAEWMEAMEKRPQDRSSQELSLIYEQLRAVNIFQAVDPNLLKQICYYGYYEDLGENVTLFRQGDVGTNWYAILEGRLEARTTINDRVNKDSHESMSLCSLGIGMVFGESVLDDSPRNATVVTTERCQLLRIEQKDFKLIWEQNRSRLEEAMLTMSSEYAKSNTSNQRNIAIIKRQLSGDILQRPQRSPSSIAWNGRPPRFNTSAWVQMQDVAIPYSALPITEEPSVDVLRCAHVLRTLVLSTAPQLIRDRKYHMRTYHRCMVGVEMVDWLLQLKINVRTRIQGVMIWQALLEEGVISHVSHEYHFKDKYIFYRFHNDVVFSTLNNRLSEVVTMQPSQKDMAEANENIAYVLSLLLQKGPDALLRMILRKLPCERTPEDLETIYDELRHIKALSHLSTSIKKELAAVLAFEAHHTKGTVLFHQGDEGRLWYIIVKGSVDVVIHGKGTVCSLYEGDDFGKLALVNDAPRAATIILTEDNCHFLSVDKDDFNRILRDVEANTVRLKEHGEDVLILQNVALTPTTPKTDKPQRHRYFVVAGTPQKILEHILETCIDVNSENIVDPLMEDFLFTHVLFMPYNQLCQEFMKFYLIESSNPTQDHDFVLNFKRKVIRFLHNWTFLIGDSVFQDATFVSLIEDLTKVVRADHLSYGHLQGALEMVMDVLTDYQRYENEKKVKNTWEIISSGHVVHVIEEPNREPNLSQQPRRPIRINDECVFKVYCADHTYCTMKMPIGTTVEMIKNSAAEKMGLQEGVLLVEVKSNRDKIILKDHDTSAQTSLSVNSRLFIIPKEHLDALTPLSEQDGRKQKAPNSIIEDIPSKELAHYITMCDWELFVCIHEYELLYHVFGRHKYQQVTANLDVFLHRFCVLQYWPATEICSTRSVNKRVQLLKKFIKIAEHCYELQNLSAFSAIMMSLGNSAVVRLSQTWEKLPGKVKKIYSDYESFLDPSRNHRNYRITAAKMSPPVIPLVPLLIKDLLFSHEGNRTYLEGLVNFEKMHIIAESLRAIRHAKASTYQIEIDVKSREQHELKMYLRNLSVINNQATLDHLSRNLETRRS